jgi:hypothetical protein
MLAADFNVRHDTVLPAALGPVLVADLDNDGDDDFIALSDGYGTHRNFTLGINGGSGRVFYTREFLVGDFHTAALGDFDGDGDVDIALARGTLGVSLVRNNGVGWFSNDQLFAAGGNADVIRAADFDNDGDDDLLVSYLTPQSAILKGGPSGFGAAARITAYPGINDNAVIADFDGDGFRDIIADVYTDATSLLRSFAMLRNTGTGEFAAHSVVSAAPQTAIVAADTNADGKPDFHVVPAPTTYRYGQPYTFGSRYTFFNQSTGPGSFAFSPYVEGPWMSSTVADFDGDSYDDVIVPNPFWWTGNFTLETHTPSGTTRTDLPIPGGTNEGSLLRTATGDFNADGRPDLLISVWRSISVLLNGSRDLGYAAPNEKLPLELSNSPQPPAVGDINGDGLPDMAVATNIANIIAINFGRGDGTFRPPLLLPAGAGTHAVALANFRGTGLGVAAVNRDSDSATVYIRAQDGFYAPITIEVPGDPISITAEDLNGDSLPDLIIGTSTGGVRIYRGVQPSADAGAVTIIGDDGVTRTTFGSTPVWSFVFVGVVSAATRVTAVSAADFDADGDRDLLVTSNLAGTVTLWWNNGNATFEASPTLLLQRTPEAYGVSTVTQAVHGLLNADTRPDIAMALGAPMFDEQGTIVDGYAVFINRGGRVFDRLSTTSQTFQANTISIRDVDRDSRADLVIGIGAAGNAARTPTGVVAVLAGSFYDYRSIVTITRGGPLITSVLATDIDGDPFTDIITTSVPAGAPGYGLRITRSVLSLPAPPTIGGVTPSVTTLARGAALTLTATGVNWVGGPVASVSFYLDSNRNHQFDSADQLIFTDANSTDGFSWTVAADWDGGATTIWARANAGGRSSNIVWTSVTVTDGAGPRIGSLSVSSSFWTNSITLTAQSVAAGASPLAAVEFFLDYDRNGVFGANDILIGRDTSSSSGWKYSSSIPAHWGSGPVRFFARAIDTGNRLSNIVSVAFTLR